MSYFLGRFLVKFTSHYCFRISINSINSVNSVNSVHSVNFVNSEQAVYSAVLPPSLMVFFFIKTEWWITFRSDCDICRSVCNIDL